MRFTAENTSGYSDAERQILDDLADEAIARYRASDEYDETLAADYEQHVTERVLSAADQSAALTGEIVEGVVRQALRRGGVL